ncbi:hypothetical protein LP419_14580 [Massilia sp. H-1]|nr:hypothetical protein LP419_14580 [Massilia sp. H-1]
MLAQGRAEEARNQFERALALGKAAKASERALAKLPGQSGQGRCRHPVRP